jgi:hypothetical protein
MRVERVVFNAFKTLTTTEQILKTVFAVPVDTLWRPECAVEDSWLFVLDEQLAFTPDDCVLVVNYCVNVLVGNEGYLVGKVQN